MRETVTGFIAFVCAALAILFGPISIAQEVAYRNKVDERLSYGTLDDRLKVFEFLAFQTDQGKLLRFEGPGVFYEMLGNIELENIAAGALRDFSRFGAGQSALQIGPGRTVMVDKKKVTEPNLVFFGATEVSQVADEQRLRDLFSDEFLREFVRVYETGDTCHRMSSLVRETIQKTLVFIKVEDETLLVNRDASVASCYYSSFLFHYGLRNVSSAAPGALNYEVSQRRFIPSLRYTYLIHWILNEKVDAGMDRDRVLKALRKAYSD